MQAAPQDQLTRCPLTSQPVARLAQFIRDRVVANGARWAIGTRGNRHSLHSGCR